MRCSLIIVSINSRFPFISFPFSVGLALTGFFPYVLLCYVSVIKSLRLFEPCPRLTRITGLLSVPLSLKCGGDTERSEALKQSIFKMADSMLHV